MIISLKYGGSSFADFVLLIDNIRVPVAHLNFKGINLWPRILNSCFLALILCSPSPQLQNSYRVWPGMGLFDPCLPYMWSSCASVASLLRSPAALAHVWGRKKKRVLIFLKSCRHFNQSCFSAFVWCVSGEQHSNREHSITLARLSEYISAHWARFLQKGNISSQMCPKKISRVANPELWCLQVPFFFYP